MQEKLKEIAGENVSFLEQIKLTLQATRELYNIFNELEKSYNENLNENKELLEKNKTIFTQSKALLVSMQELQALINDEKQDFDEKNEAFKELLAQLEPQFIKAKAELLNLKDFVNEKATLIQENLNTFENVKTEALQTYEIKLNEALELFEAKKQEAKNAYALFQEQKQDLENNTQTLQNTINTIQTTNNEILTEALSLKDDLIEHYELFEQDLKTKEHLALQSLESQKQDAIAKLEEKQRKLLKNLAQNGASGTLELQKKPLELVISADDSGDFRTLLEALAYVESLKLGTDVYVNADLDLTNSDDLSYGEVIIRVKDTYESMKDYNYAYSAWTFSYDGSRINVPITICAYEEPLNEADLQTSPYNELGMKEQDLHYLTIFDKMFYKNCKIQIYSGGMNFFNFKYALKFKNINIINIEDIEKYRRSFTERIYNFINPLCDLENFNFNKPQTKEDYYNFTYFNAFDYVWFFCDCERVEFINVELSGINLCFYQSKGLLQNVNASMNVYRNISFLYAYYSFIELKELSININSNRTCIFAFKSEFLQSGKVSLQTNGDDSHILSGSLHQSSTYGIVLIKSSYCKNVALLYPNKNDTSLSGHLAFFCFQKAIVLEKGSEFISLDDTHISFDMCYLCFELKDESKVQLFCNKTEFSDAFNHNFNDRALVRMFLIKHFLLMENSSFTSMIHICPLKIIPDNELINILSGVPVIVKIFNNSRLFLYQGMDFYYYDDYITYNFEVSNDSKFFTYAYQTKNIMQFYLNKDSINIDYEQYILKKSDFIPLLPSHMHFIGEAEAKTLFDSINPIDLKPRLL